ncbi:hypothetical protein CBL_21258, partial [Carabus blaptoides fortunei]
ICHVGNQNLQTMLWLVLVPHTTCLVVGIILLIVGVVLISRGPKGTALRAAGTVPATGTARARAKSAPDLLKLGVCVLLTACGDSVPVWKFFNGCSLSKCLGLKLTSTASVKRTACKVTRSESPEKHCNRTQPLSLDGGHIH